MEYSISFQYKSKNMERPDDVQQDEEFKLSEPLWIPNVGDSISCLYGEERKAFKVLTRHFSYLTKNINVNIVVTDIDSNEMASRLNE